jgi:hypothetical protein
VVGDVVVGVVVVGEVVVGVVVVGLVVVGLVVVGDVVDPVVETMGTGVGGFETVKVRPTPLEVTEGIES